MQARTPLKIQADVVFALFQQDLRNQFSHYSAGNFWFIVEPLFMVSFFILIFGLRGRGEFGDLEPPVLLMVGIVPFLIAFQQTMKGIMGAPQQAARFLMFRQIVVMDFILVKALSQLVLVPITLFIFCVAFFWLGLEPLPAEPLEVIAWILVCWMFGIGLGLGLMYVAKLAPEIGSLVGLLIFPLKFLSAVFFPMAIVPEPYRTWLAYNPLVHVMEAIREHWFASYVSPVLDIPYAFAWMTFLLFWGLCLYRLKWQASLVK